MLAVAFAAAGVVESIFVNSSGHSRPLTAVAAVALASPVVWRRRHTLGAVIGFMAVAAAAAPLDVFIFAHTTTPFITVLVLAYTVGRHEAGRRMWLGLAVLAVLIPLTGGIGTRGDPLWTAILRCTRACGPRTPQPGLPTA